MDTNTLLIIFVALTFLAILLQAGVLLGMFLTLRKTAKVATEATSDLRATVLPLIHTSRDLIERVSPQIATITAGLAELTELAHKQTKGASVSISDVAERVSAQINRIDRMLTVTLDAVERTAGAIEHTVATPVRQVNGVVAALKAIIDTYRHTSSASTRYNGRRHDSVPDPDSDIVI
jgi:methyl-accepting chemotaxis protein